jgi:inositol hexakisphosphate/diphosphoinositol-pentakisphosphate kinase
MSKIVVGVCARDKKARSLSMKEILSRLPSEIFDVVIFGDECILHMRVEEWPLCNVLLAFYSKGFPLAKAEQYAELRKPFLLNDLRMQRVMLDRREVYRVLLEAGVDVPKHVVLDRDDPKGPQHVLECDECIFVNGVRLSKPVVEKPVDAGESARALSVMRI